MFSKCTLELKSDSELSYQMSSLFQGVFMELIPDSLAEEFHESELHQYTQHLEFRKGKWYWIVTVLNDKLDEVIIKEILMNLKHFELKKHKINVEVVNAEYDCILSKQLMKDFYTIDSPKYIDLMFLTPTSFKRNGEYLNYPDLRCIYQSLMSKYDMANSEEKMIDQETLEQLCESSKITQYDLKTIPFCLEKIKIVGFIGKITIRVNGSTTMANFANLLFRFGEYSGVGIKTAIGMGAIKRLGQGE